MLGPRSLRAAQSTAACSGPPCRACPWGSPSPPKGPCQCSRGPLPSAPASFPRPPVEGHCGPAHRRSLGREPNRARPVPGTGLHPARATWGRCGLRGAPGSESASGCRAELLSGDPSSHKAVTKSQIARLKWAEDLSMHFFQRRRTNGQRIHGKMPNITNPEGMRMKTPASCHPAPAGVATVSRPTHSQGPRGPGGGPVHCWRERRPGRPPGNTGWRFLETLKQALAGAAPWTERRPVDQRVAGSGPGRGAGLGCRPGPSGGGGV